MNWKQIIEKAQPLISKTKEIANKTTPIVNKAKTYWSNTIAFMWKQLEQTPMFLKTEEEYNIHASAKRAISIAYDSRDSVSEDIRVMSPIWSTLAWTDTAQLKFIEISTNEDLSRNIGFKWPLEMRVSYMWEEYIRCNTLEDIKNWWKTRTYKKDNPKESTDEDNEWNDISKSIESNDPILSVEKGN